jgi:quercetin dioxygenase-like cupin family protein
MSAIRVARPEDSEQGLSADDVERHYTGPAELPRVHEVLGTSAVAINVVTFAAGSRTLPHAHSSDQVLYIASGVAIVAIEGGDDVRVDAGEFVLLPAACRTCTARPRRDQRCTSA